MNPMPEQKRILLVTDASPAWTSFADTLAADGYELVTAGNAEEAQVRRSCRRPDLVVVDLDLPNEDGWQLAEQLNASHPHLPVVATTTDADARLRAAGHGVDVVVMKPCGTQQLNRAVRELLALTEQAQLGQIAATLRALKRRSSEKEVTPVALEVTKVV